MNKPCFGYCGISCVDGSCPIANMEEYQERCIPVVWNCSQCHYCRFCEDCAFLGMEDICPYDMYNRMKKFYESFGHPLSFDDSVVRVVFRPECMRCGYCFIVSDFMYPPDGLHFCTVSSDFCPENFKR